MVLQWKDRVPHLAVSLGCVDFKADICSRLANGFSRNTFKSRRKLKQELLGIQFGKLFENHILNWERDRFIVRTFVCKSDLAGATVSTEKNGRVLLTVRS